MARKALVDDANGTVLQHGFSAFTPAAGQSVHDVPEDYRIDNRTERFDVGKPAKKRAATALETADYDAAQKAAHGADVTRQKPIVAVVLWYLDRVNELRVLHALPPITASEARQGIADKYKAL